MLLKPGIHDPLICIGTCRAPEPSSAQIQATSDELYLGDNGDVPGILAILFDPASLYGSRDSPNSSAKALDLHAPEHNGRPENTAWMILWLVLRMPAWQIKH